MKTGIFFIFLIHNISLENNPSCFLKVAQSCLTLCNLMECIVHGILQARILEWIAIPFSKGSSQPRDRTQVSHIADGFFTSRATREARIQNPSSRSLGAHGSYTSLLRNIYSGTQMPLCGSTSNLNIQIQKSECKP